MKYSLITLLPTLTYLWRRFVPRPINRWTGRRSIPGWGKGPIRRLRPVRW